MEYSVTSFSFFQSLFFRFSKLHMGQNVLMPDTYIELRAQFLKFNAVACLDTRRKRAVRAALRGWLAVDVLRATTACISDGG